MKVYLDNAASTKVDLETVKEMEKCFLECYGNPSSAHFKGVEAEEVMNKARKVIAKKINADPEKIVFTSGGTEANNLCIKGIALNGKKRHVVTSAVEHDSVMNSCKFLEKHGFKVTFLNVDKDGMVDLKQLEKSITKNTALVSIIHGNNEVGTIQPMEKIGKICKKKNVPLHTDAVQSFLKVPIDVKKMNLSALSLSSHKIHGPKGVGVAYVGVKMKKIMDGGKQELGLRPGTQNVPGIVGMGKAVSIWKSADEKLRDYMIEKILSEVPGTKLNGPKKRLSNNVNMSFEGLIGDTMMLHLSSLGVAAATGSACHEKEIKVSHVLHAMGVSDEDAKSTLRFTLSKHTTKKEIDYAIKQLKTVVESLRRLE